MPSDAMRKAFDAWACAEENQAAAAVIERAIADAVEQERARIVEWLLVKADAAPGEWGPIVASVIESCASAIDRGDHKERADG